MLSNKGVFEKNKDTYILDRSVQYAQWTLPSLMADLQQTAYGTRTVLQTDFQEVGALLTNNLASKLAQVLFPTQYPFFRADASGELLSLMQEQNEGEDTRKVFSKLEMEANKNLFMNAGYSALILMLKHLIVTGNAVVYRDSKKKTITVYGLQSYSIKRDGRGEVVDCVIREYTLVSSLPESILKEVRKKDQGRFNDPNSVIEVYTRIRREYVKDNPTMVTTVEVGDIPVGEAGRYPIELCPYIFPTWTLIPGESYGRGLVGDFAGGFAKLSELSRSSTLYAVETLRVINLVGPSSGADVDAIARAESGEWVRGDPGAIQAYESGQANKLQIVGVQINELVQRLSVAFMYTGGGAVRNQERVTAFEVSQLAQEAELTLGGVYSSLSASTQVPLAYLLMKEVSEDALPGILSGELLPDVTAGIPALGRSGDVQNLLLAAQEIAGIAPVLQVDQRINPARVVDVILAGRSVDPDSIMFTPEEQKANAEAQAAAQQAQMQLQQAEVMANTTALTGG